MIEVKNLSKSYGKHTAIRDVSFSVQKGEILGLLGRNGAGKTTTMNILTGYLCADGGEARIDGTEIHEDPVTVLRKVGYLPEHPPLYDNMRVSEYLEFAAEIKGVPSAKRQNRLDYVIGAVSIGDYRKKLIGTLSKGYRQRVGLAAAIVHDPQVLILDEPTIGLDPNQIVDIRHLVLHLAGDHTVILSTHILSEAEQICGRAAIIHNGVISAEGTLDHLRNRIAGKQTIRLVLETNAQDTENKLKSVGGVRKVTQLHSPSAENVWDIQSDSGNNVKRELFQCAVRNNWIITEMKSGKNVLENIFKELTLEKETEKNN